MMHDELILLHVLTAHQHIKGHSVP